LPKLSGGRDGLIVAMGKTHDVVEETPDMGALVNRLAGELAQAQREHAALARKVNAGIRTLETRTRELTEARTALTLLLSTLDCIGDGVLAIGQFGRAMHYNLRFIETWAIPEDKLSALTEESLLTMQLARVKDPVSFLAGVEQRRLNPEQPHTSRLELTDGRTLECHYVPQRVNGKRVGTVTRYVDVTEREQLARLVQVQARNPSHTSLQPVRNMPA
jgi:PAS domain-containing protein